ncbi:hypothetical protein DICSQDRAFT_170054 [Dichomitus squalens LYAD-421 SS1]|uniref:Uncharacterized protein n=1 Tax=Dichomitus squalens (strain LYAD-421) TaxID=732165 RepID=R7T0A1_DICSQ|nr:uncharacterized protein DICSQDRAFT_170054 [Dichomitus squalens LYAD-421 SS1]EJF61638.1 hypothetical protein DICSQDRAFT_170054 [Dichomitus squalens LYAD-421 SS1]
MTLVPCVFQVDIVQRHPSAVFSAVLNNAAILFVAPSSLPVALNSAAVFSATLNSAMVLQTELNAIHATLRSGGMVVHRCATLNCSAALNSAAPSLVMLNGADIFSVMPNRAMVSQTDPNAIHAAVRPGDLVAQRYVKGLLSPVFYVPLSCAFATQLRSNIARPVFHSNVELSMLKLPGPSATAGKRGVSDIITNLFGFLPGSSCPTERSNKLVANLLHGQSGKERGIGLAVCGCNRPRNGLSRSSR